MILLSKSILLISSRGFTLIELLIVVAIIAILAAVAVPNFLEAQVRDKVSRTQNDMRTMATACEAYRVDYNAYPIPVAVMASSLAVVYPMPSPNHNLYLQNFLPSAISTPISYLTGHPIDVFWQEFQQPFPEITYTYYIYMNWEYTRKLVADAGMALNVGQQARVRSFGDFVMFAAGPDGDRKDLAPSAAGVTSLINGVYDPTNGTTSNGDIIRTQCASAGICL